MRRNAHRNARIRGAHASDEIAVGVEHDRERARPESRGEPFGERRHTSGASAHLIDIGRDDRDRRGRRPPPTSNSRATAQLSRGSTARPYNVSVGTATIPPLFIASAILATASGSGRSGSTVRTRVTLQ